MEGIESPKKVVRHVLKALEILCDETTDSATTSEVYEQVRYQMRNLIPVAHLQNEVYKCLEGLCDKGLARRIPDGEIGSLNKQYSICVNEVSTNIKETKLSVGDSSFNPPYTENFTNVAEFEVSNREESSANKSIENNNLTALDDEISASSEGSNDCIFTDNNDKMPLPKFIKIEHQMMEPTKDNEI
uniref:Uncharacterized protein n=1 Tax=Glossina brevipalpis TaxID=37001 RepID=A0A1A9X4C3_9MUSC